MNMDIQKVIDDISRCLMDGCYDCEYLDQADGCHCFDIVLTEALEAICGNERGGRESASDDQRMESGMDNTDGACGWDADGGACIGKP